VTDSMTWAAGSDSAPPGGVERWLAVVGNGGANSTRPPCGRCRRRSRQCTSNVAAHPARRPRLSARTRSHGREPFALSVGAFAGRDFPLSCR
jgi:hypothetical protein